MMKRDGLVDAKEAHTKEIDDEKRCMKKTMFSLAMIVGVAILFLYIAALKLVQRIHVNPTPINIS
jgi:hypothetical protein